MKRGKEKRKSNTFHALILSIKFQVSPYLNTKVFVLVSSFRGFLRSFPASLAHFLRLTRIEEKREDGH